MNNKVQITEHELLATLKHSSIPTVIVEGKDDMIFYRRMENDFNEIGLNFLPAGNKSSVLNIKQKIDNNGEINIPITYIVDQDTWVNFGIPSDTKDIITTKGYSIENDLIEDGNLHKLLTPEERISFEKDLNKFIYWYSLTLNRCINKLKKQDGCSYVYQLHPGKILDDDSFFQQETILASEENYPTSLYEDIKSNWITKLRGKSLLALLLRQLNRKKRWAKHSQASLMDTAASQKGPNYIRIMEYLRKNLKISQIDAPNQTKAQ